MLLLEVAFARDRVDQRFEKAQNLRRQYLKLPDQREVIISYHPHHGENGTYKVRIFMRKEGNVIWDKTFSEDMDEYWIGAAFLPVVKGAYFYDLNNNGDLEIAVVVSHGGSAVWNTPSMIFTVKETALEFLRKQQVNDEFSEHVYTSKKDFENPTYKCSSCIEREYYYTLGKTAPLNDKKHETSTKQ